MRRLASIGVLLGLDTLAVATTASIPSIERGARGLRGSGQVLQ